MQMRFGIKNKRKLRPLDTDKMKVSERVSGKGHKLFFTDFEMTRFPYFTLDFYLFKILVLSFFGDRIPFPDTLLVGLPAS